MTTGSSIAAFALGAGISLATSWVLVSRLERVGERLGLSEALLGMVAALAADAPEITASVTALAHHQRGIGAGVTIGSNVFNLAALLGLGAVVAGRIGLHRKLVILGGTVALMIAAVCVPPWPESLRRGLASPWCWWCSIPTPSSWAPALPRSTGWGCRHGGRHGSQRPSPRKRPSPKRRSGPGVAVPSTPSSRSAHSRSL